MPLSYDRPNLLSLCCWAKATVGCRPEGCCLSFVFRLKLAFGSHQSGVWVVPAPTSQQNSSSLLPSCQQCTVTEWLFPHFPLWSWQWSDLGPSCCWGSSRTLWSKMVAPPACSVPHVCVPVHSAGSPHPLTTGSAGPRVSCSRGCFWLFHCFSTICCAAALSAAF